MASTRNPMAAGMDLRLSGRPELRALPGLLHTLRLLPAGQAEVAARVERALADNPMLDRGPGTPCPGCGRHRSRPGCPGCTGARPAPASDPLVDPFATVASEARWEIRSDCREALPIVLAHLTERGTLDCAPAEIAAAHRLAAGTVAEAIRAIKVVGPVGIAECSIPALLAAQARRLVADGSAAPLLVAVVEQYLDAVADDDPTAAAAGLGVPLAAVVEAFRLVRTRLRPWAGPVGQPDARSRQAPDVLVYRGAGAELEVEVADSRWFGLRLTAVPSSVLANAGAADWLAPHRQAALDLIRQVDARATVLRQVATAAVHRQVDFFDRGPAGHRRLIRCELAGELGMHPSTVSRAVAGKLVRCPSGRIMAMAELFGDGVAAKARIAELATDRPMSDTQLGTALRAAGFVLARRTVAKYRAELGIPAGGRRRT